MRCCATCRGRRSPRWHRSRFPANGAAPRGGATSEGGSLGVGRARWVCGGRRESIPGGLAAACSCALSCAHGKTGVGPPAQPARGMPRAHAADTPANPSRPATDSFRARPPRKRKRRSEADRFALHPRMAWIYRVDQGRHPPAIAVDPPSPGNCRRRGGSDGGGVNRMDAATKPPWTGLRRPPPSDPPRHLAVIRLLLLLLLLLLQVQGCKPCKVPTSPSLQSPAGPARPATAAASATPDSSHHAVPAGAATPATSPLRCNRARPRAVRR